MDTHSSDEGLSGSHTVGRWVFWGFVAVAGYFLYTEHRAHLMSGLPYVLLAACPLMHLFHHHGRHRHAGNQDPAQQTALHQTPKHAGAPGAQPDSVRQPP